ncbi:RNA polymerase II transcription elongation factor-domain-containing protein [Fusarium flagelliforme]|uniref:Ell-associated factor n=1 Tax=Fusarium flagelliforme TaxID=2675880 RepID=A0A395N388_9HYPO|nr:RNA polymerase II transcription elongation factor-domain-containing protein [Fusarium flagelliforme]KAH7185594.1 RNA polymerase II transcription elongation factor-domain-containing protein [Fusarium flagelliforme]RFN54582.1 ell-associated factor [Fusarium flagelliforme]
MAASGLIDPTKTGNYPVILGDALLGKTSNEIFTGIKYNHKPTLSSDQAPNSARIKPSVPGKTTSYDLSYTDNDEKYAFTGTRNTNSGQYVLYFDPSREAFILDLVDSTFNMNITRLPGNGDSDSLRRQYPQIDSSSSRPGAKTEKNTTSTEKPSTKARAKPSTQKKEVKRKPEKKQAPKNVALSLPVPLPAQPQKPAEPKKRTPAPEEEEEEDDDDDGGLLVENPGADTSAARRTDFSPAFPSFRRFDEFMDQRESEGDDADGEEDDEPDFEFKLPSPVNNRSQYEIGPDHMDVDEEEGEEEEPEVDLAKELEDAFENFENSQQDSPDGDESEISEED